MICPICLSNTKKVDANEFKYGRKILKLKIDFVYTCKCPVLFTDEFLFMIDNNISSKNYINKGFWESRINNFKDVLRKYYENVTPLADEKYTDEEKIEIAYHTMRKDIHANKPKRPIEENAIDVHRDLWRLIYQLKDNK